MIEVLDSLTQKITDLQRQVKNYITAQETSRSIRAKIYRNSAQVIPNATVTALSFTTAAYNTDSFWVVGSPTIITIPYDGIYSLIFAIDWTYSATGARYMEVTQNATTTIASDSRNATTDGATNVRMHCIFEGALARNDQLVCNVYQTAGGNLATNAINIHLPSITIRRIDKL